MSEVGDYVARARAARGPDEARRCLDDCLAMLTTTRAEPRHWCRLAGYYVELLDDAEAALACLDRGLDTIDPSIDELLKYFLPAYLELGEEGTAWDMVSHAEASGLDAWWALMDAYRKLGDEARAKEIFESALATATTVERCTRIAIRAEVERPELVSAALAKGEQVATTADDWLELAMAYYDRIADHVAIARCLERAVAALPASEPRAESVAARELHLTRARIAQAYRLRLGDDAAADRIWPRGTPPATLLAPRRTLEGWHSDRSRLFDWLRPQLTREALSNIAAADFDTEMHLSALREIHETGLIPQPLLWFPGEALERAQWDYAQRRGIDHLARAFACTVLCLNDPEMAPSRVWLGLESTIAELVDSCRKLGAEALAGAAGLLVAICESLAENDRTLPLARLALLITAAACDPHDARLPSLCSRILEDEARPFGQMWDRLIDEVLAPIPHFAPIAARLRSPSDIGE